MRTVIYTLLGLCILQAAFSQSCATGYIAYTSWDTSKAKCLACHPLCKDCTGSPTNCANYIDKIQGLDRAVAPGTIVCPGASATYGVIGYNKQTDSCDQCIAGCSACLIDYNICSSCKAGYDFDRVNGQCIRATLGLAAVVLALSVLILLVVIITCICACKL